MRKKGDFLGIILLIFFLSKKLVTVLKRYFCFGTRLRDLKKDLQKNLLQKEKFVFLHIFAITKILFHQNTTIQTIQQQYKNTKEHFRFLS